MPAIQMSVVLPGDHYQKIFNVPEYLLFPDLAEGLEGDESNMEQCWSGPFRICLPQRRE